MYMYVHVYIMYVHHSSSFIIHSSYIYHHNIHTCTCTYMYIQGETKVTHKLEIFDFPMFSASKEFFESCKLCGPETIKHLNWGLPQKIGTGIDWRMQKNIRIPINSAYYGMFYSNRNYFSTVILRLISITCTNRKDFCE